MSMAYGYPDMVMLGWPVILAKLFLGKLSRGRLLVHIVYFFHHYLRKEDGHRNVFNDQSIIGICRTRRFILALIKMNWLQY